MKATLPSGALVPIRECYIDVDNLERIEMRILPDISDSKSANYADETAIGRSFPIKNYSYSENRTISWTVHFMVCQDGDQEDIMDHLRLLESCVYPTQEETPYAPPPICQIRCGELLSKDGPLCCILRSYSVKFPTDVAWEEYQDSYVPYKLDVDLQFEVVYDSKCLPYASDIVASGGDPACI